MLLPRRRERTIRGTVAVVSRSEARYSAFSQSLLAMRLPADVHISWNTSCDAALGRNTAVESARGDWIWFLDDDHVWESGQLERLLRRGVDVVSPLILMRDQPHRPAALVERLEDGSYRRLALASLPTDGRLLAVAATGGAGLLVRRCVLDAIPPPWFESTYRELGDRPGRVGEDVRFCEKATEAGFSIYVDTAETMGHVAPFAVWPLRTSDGWSVSVRPA